ncbi:hypothetical protein DB88DRAFT_475316 [Papiliotrema laurentii]|uniref:Uncharacterized protein n=1 Tax=Papiliotrema laurentii TaxID=5418 RepID=A0AAD9FQ19_PAPLA|nr:hypothetical protein DB88DRAFT_475316 [Papiliotrema laurentii]
MAPLDTVKYSNPPSATASSGHFPTLPSVSESGSHPGGLATTAVPQDRWLIQTLSLTTKAITNHGRVQVPSKLELEARGHPLDVEEIRDPNAGTELSRLWHTQHPVVIPSGDDCLRIQLMGLVMEGTLRRYLDANEDTLQDMQTEGVDGSAIGPQISEWFESAKDAVFRGELTDVTKSNEQPIEGMTRFEEVGKLQTFRVEAAPRDREEPTVLETKFGKALPAGLHPQVCQAIWGSSPDNPLPPLCPDECLWHDTSSSSIPGLTCDHLTRVNPEQLYKEFEQARFGDGQFQSLPHKQLCRGTQWRCVPLDWAGRFPVRPDLSSTVGFVHGQTTRSDGEEAKNGHGLDIILSDHLISDSDPQCIPGFHSAAGSSLNRAIMSKVSRSLAHSILALNNDEMAGLFQEVQKEQNKESDKRERLIQTLLDRALVVRAMSRDLEVEVDKEAPTHHDLTNHKVAELFEEVQKEQDKDSYERGRILQTLLDRALVVGAMSRYSKVEVDKEECVAMVALPLTESGPFRRLRVTIGEPPVNEGAAIRTQLLEYTWKVEDAPKREDPPEPEDPLSPRNRLRSNSTPKEVGSCSPCHSARLTTGDAG